MGQAVPEKDDAGRVVGYVGTITDVTEKKELETRLLRSQRLESVGRLASGIAHDLNNILAPMLMSAPVLREAISDPDIRQLVDTIESSAVRGAGVIKQLLTFGRGLEGERVPVQLKSLVQDMLNIIRETFPKNIIAARETPASAWLVRGDATQLHQILMNLCVNARDAMPDGGKLTLELENVEVNEAVASMNPGACPGRYVALSVTDTGTGIPPENLDKIFDPFFTTKGGGQGNRAGIVHGHRHRQKPQRVYSGQQPVGTRHTVQGLPAGLRHTERQRKEAEAGAPGAGPGGTGSVGG